MPAFERAFDPEHGTGPVPSPCISICMINPASGWCSGCQRSLDEVIAWQGASQDEKRRIWTLINDRRAVTRADE